MLRTTDDERTYYWNGSGFTVARKISDRSYVTVHELVRDGGTEYILQFSCSEPDMPKVAPTPSGKHYLDVMYDLTVEEYAPSVNIALSKD